MRALYVLTRMRMADVLRTPSSALFFFLLPLVLLAVLGVVFANGHPFEERTVLVVGDAAALPALGEGVLVSSSPSEAEARARLASRMASLVLLHEGEGWRVIAGPREELFARGVEAALGGEPRTASIDVEPLPRWGYVQFLFPGLLCFTVLTAGLFGMGHTMARYRETLLLKKLATTPLPRVTFVAAQILSRTLLVLVQVALLIAVAWVAFDLPLDAGRFAWMLGVALLGLLAFMGLGFGLACVVTGEGLVVDAISALNIPLVFASEMFFPLDSLPAPIAAVGGVLPTTLVVRALREILVRGSCEPTMLVAIAAWALASFALATTFFRWHR